MHVRIEDPASRDQDDAPWHSGRFAERVRREWNPITSDAIGAAGDDMDALAAAIQKRAGGDQKEIVARLERFRRVERDPTASARDDGLVRPGAPV